MQTDFMAMAQGQQGQKPSPEVLKQNIVQFMTDAGVLPPQGNETYNKVLAQIDEFVALMLKGDEQAISKHPIYAVLEQALIAMQDEVQKMQQPTGGPVPQQGGAPKDFASMMPPTPGGGMGGR